MFVNSLMPAIGRGGELFQYYTMNFNEETSKKQHDSKSTEQGISLTKVYIGGLIEDIGNDKLQYEFEKFGKIMKVWVARSPYSNGYAFVDYFEPSDAARAVEEMNGKQRFGGKLIVQLSKPGNKKNKPYMDKKNTVDKKVYSNLKYDYSFDHDTKLPKELGRPSYMSRGRRNSPGEQCDQRRDDSLRQQSPTSRCRERYRDNSEGRRYSRDYICKRRRSRSRDHDLSRKRCRSRDDSPDRKGYESDRRSTSLDTPRYRNEPLSGSFNSAVDDETIRQIKESVLRETLPQMCSIFLREIIQNNPANFFQNPAVNAPVTHTTSPQNIPFASGAFLQNNMNRNMPDKLCTPTNLMNVSSPLILANGSYNSPSVMKQSFPVTSTVNSSATYRNPNKVFNNYNAPNAFSSPVLAPRGIPLENASHMVQSYIPTNNYSHQSDKMLTSQGTFVPERAQPSIVRYPHLDTNKVSSRLPNRSTRFIANTTKPLTPP